MRSDRSVPIHPASAMFVSNHGSLKSPGDGSCQPTASVYLGEWYDWLCCFSNFHIEHHDFPDVPAFRLRALRDAAPSFYSSESIAGSRDGWWETMRRTFAGREFYACSGEMLESVDSGSRGQQDRGPA
jgi:fatty acid desaturase